ncbi:MAG: hypothetical protein AB1442_00595 [Nitrospirota bacterium]
MKNLSHNVRADIHPIDISSSPAGADTVAFFEDILQSGISLRTRATGRSMGSFLQGGEILTIRKVLPSSLRRGDLIFFKTPQGHPVMHRIIKKKKGRRGELVFRTRGDALRLVDGPVHEDRILGKVCAIEKALAEGGMKRIDMEKPLWRAANFSLVLVGLARDRIASAPFLSGLLRLIRKTFV